MNATTEEYFISSNMVNSMTGKDYENLGILINAIKAFSRSTYQCVYIIDYLEQNFLFVSDNFKYLCGLSSDEIKDFGYRFFTDMVLEEDHDMLV